MRDSAKMLEDARKQFPELVAYLVCLGMPTGLALGIRGGMRRNRVRPPFRWGRAVVAGGLAGIVSGMIFGYWMLEGGFFPLIAGFGDIQSQASRIALQFGVALTIGMTFGLLFQRDVRGYGSCMGWGLGYAVLWWFIGPLTFFPLSRRTPLDWSMDSASQLFGALVGHILYGLILGVVYATFDRVWVRLFIQSDPLTAVGSSGRSRRWYHFQPVDGRYGRTVARRGSGYPAFCPERPASPLVGEHIHRYELRPTV